MSASSASRDPVRETDRVSGDGGSSGRQLATGPLTGLAVLVAALGSLLVWLTPLDGLGIGARVVALAVALVAVAIGARARSWRALAAPIVVAMLLAVNLLRLIGN